MRRVLAAVFGSVCLIIGVLGVLPMPIPKALAIDYEAELERLTRAGQSADPNAKNGWDALCAIAKDAERIRKEIETREFDADQTLTLTGREAEIEPWTYDVVGWSRCEARTARDERLIAEYWSRIAAERILERVEELRGFGVFVMDFADRPAERFRQLPGGGSLSASGGDARAICVPVLASLQRSLESADWEDARSRFEDAMFLSGVFDLQADQMMAMNSNWLRGSALRAVADAGTAGRVIPPAFLRSVMEIDAREARVPLDRVVEALRLEELEMIDALADIFRSGRVSVMRWVVLGRGWSIVDARKEVELGRARVAAMMGMDEDACAAEMARWNAEAEDRDFASMLTWDAAMQRAGNLVAQRWQRAREHDVTLMVIAVALYASEHGGAPPESLGALVPEYLKELPKDPYAADGMYRYIAGPTMKDVVVYSVGFDGEDNGGKVWKEHPDIGSREEGKGYDVVVTWEGCGSE